MGVNRPFFIANLLRYLAEKILPLNTTNFRGDYLAAIGEKFGWLPHSTRAALTGLRKSGYELDAENPGNGKPLRYRIIGKPTADAA